MHTQKVLKSFGKNTIYLKPVQTDDLPEEMKAQANGLEIIYAVHNTKGEQVALVANEQIAATLAEQNNLHVVSVH